MTFCKGEISGQIQACYKEIKSNIHGKLLPENHFRKTYWKQKVKVQPFKVTIRKQAECHCNCVRSAYIFLHDSDFRKLFYGEKKNLLGGGRSVSFFSFVTQRLSITWEKSEHTDKISTFFFFPATNIYTAYLVTMLSSNMLKIRVHLLPAAELSYRKGGGWAGPKSRCQLQGCKWPGERLAGHSHGTEFFPKKKAARESCAWMTQEF